MLSQTWLGRVAAHEEEDKKLKELTESFMTGYWGQMILVDDKRVENSMIRFHDQIIDYQRNRSDSKSAQGSRGWTRQGVSNFP